MFNKLPKQNEIKSISTFRNKNKHKKRFQIDESINPDSYSNKTFSPIESYYSCRVSKKYRNISLNSYSIKTFRRDSSNDRETHRNKGIAFSLDSLNNFKVKSQNEFSISNVNFVLLSNKKKDKSFEENNTNNVKITLNKYILNDLNIDNSFNQYEKKYEMIDDDIPISVLDKKKHNLKMDYPRKNKNINIYNSENENSNSQTKTNTFKNSYNTKLQKENNNNNNNNNINIKSIILQEEIKKNISPRKVEDVKQKKTMNSFFRKFDMKTKIKLPNFSWIMNNNKNENQILKNKTMKNSNKNYKIIQKSQNLKNNNKQLFKSFNTSESNIDKIKIINSKDLYKLQRGENYYNSFSNQNTGNFFQQSEIYYRLTHLKK